MIIEGTQTLMIIPSKDNPSWFCAWLIVTKLACKLRIAEGLPLSGPSL